MKLDDTIDLWRKVYESGYALDRHDRHTRDELRRRLQPIPPPARLLDLGCGRCEWLSVYLEHGAEVDLVDAADFSTRFAGVKSCSSTSCCTISLASSDSAPSPIAMCSSCRPPWTGSTTWWSSPS